jgi:hypothetical protein
MDYKTFREMQDAERIAQREEFSTNQPKAPMKIVTKCERIQPTCVGTAANGEPIWEGREMPRWQMEMLRLKYYGDFMAHWIKRRFFESTGFEMTQDTGSMELTDWTDAYKRKRAAQRRSHTGD